MILSRYISHEWDSLVRSLRSSLEANESFQEAITSFNRANCITFNQVLEQHGKTFDDVRLEVFTRLTSP